MKVITFFLFSIIGISLWSQCPPQSWNMTLLDQWNNPDPNLYGLSGNTAYNDVWGFVVNGKEYAVIGGRDSFYIHDVSDPNNITLVQSVYQGDISTWRDFKFHSNHLYSIVDSGTNPTKGIVVYDVSGLPGSISKVQELNSKFGKCHNIYIDETVSPTRIYAVGMPQSDDICVYTLADPGNPVLGGCYDLDLIENISGNGYIHDVFVKDNIAYGSHGYGGYHAWDMSDLNNVQYLGGLDNLFFDAGYVHSSWNSDDDNYAIVATEVGSDPKMYWVDQSNLMNMQVLSDYKDPVCSDNGNTKNKRPHNPYIIGDKIYVSNYHDGIVVLQIKPDNTLERIAYYDTYPENSDYSAAWRGAWGAYPYLPSGIILGSDLTHGLFTLQFDNLSSYTFIGPGTDWNNSSNWENNQKPPMNFDGLIKINHDVIANMSIVNSLTGRMDVESGVTITYTN